MSITGNTSVNAGKKEFSAAPGSNFTISYQATGNQDPGDNFSFSLSGFDVGGLALPSNKLTLIPVSPSGYNSRSTSPAGSSPATSDGTAPFRYYTTDYAAGNAGTSKLYSMTFQISPSTPVDSYQLRVIMAGGPGPDWAQTENILVSAVSAVPEPQAFAVVGGFGLLGFAAIRRWVKSSSRS